jgi:MFS family permease
LIAFGVVLWSIFTMASGAAKGFITLALPRMFIGVGESILTPTSMSLLGDAFPPKRMGFASGFYYLGVPLGVAISLLLVGFVADIKSPVFLKSLLGETIGWRGCFYMLGIVGVFLGLCMLLFKDKKRIEIQNSTNFQEEKLSFAEVMTILVNALKKSPALMLTISGGVFYHIILGAAAFEQIWLVEERGFDRSVIAQISGIIAVFAGLAGVLFGGLVSDWWLEKTNQGRPIFLFWLSLILLPIGVIYRFVEPTTVIFWVGVVIGYFQLGCFYGPTFSTVQELVPEKIRATIVAFYILCINLIGLTIGSLGAGILIDLTRDTLAEPYTWSLLVFGFIGSLAIPCYYIAGRRYAKDKANLETAI